mmetsp:Transcript_22760/g.42303  ORF Transcript_22760/g.42303 Transcript_22760/m.42303 type:complete len:114 (-) Transcript_22760:260-601(-)
MATTPPMKNPTAMELWNFLMIMVPPILNAKSIKADHIDVKVSLMPRVDMTAQDMSARTPVSPRMEYHHPAMSRLEEPPHSESASSAVYVDKDPPMMMLVVYYMILIDSLLVLT